jgi:hypothetical protein
MLLDQASILGNPTFFSSSRSFDVQQLSNLSEDVYHENELKVAHNGSPRNHSGKFITWHLKKNPNLTLTTLT